MDGGGEEVKEGGRVVGTSQRRASIKERGTSCGIHREGRGGGKEREEKWRG